MTTRLRVLHLLILSICSVAFFASAKSTPAPVRYPLVLEVEIGRCASGAGECVVREVLRKESATNASLSAILETTGSTNKPLTLALNDRNAIILQLENLPPSAGLTVT